MKALAGGLLIWESLGINRGGSGLEGLTGMVLRMLSCPEFGIVASIQWMLMDR